MNIQELILLAEKSRESAYAPYSKFTVGAALLCDDGSIYTGCNIENASFTPTCCAERVAMLKAISDGKRSFTSIAISGGEQGQLPRTACYPCGVCLQVLSEFASPDLQIVLSDGSIVTLNELLPKNFILKD